MNINSDIQIAKPVRADLQKSGTTKSDNIAAEKKKLYKAAKEMESLFLYQLMKTMRSTIPKGVGGDENVLSSSNSEDIYTQMFDQELSSMMAGKSDRSIAAVLYRSMEKTLEAQSGGIATDNKLDSSDLKSLFPKKQNILINERKMVPIESDNKINLKLGKNIDRFDKLIERISEKHQLNPNLVKSVIKAESNGDSRAVSPAGAKGLMQLTDTTATEMGVDDVFWPADNIDGGARYLRKMLDRFGDPKLALAAYNAGPGNVDRYNGVPPFKETENYVEKVINMAGTENLEYLSQ